MTTTYQFSKIEKHKRGDKKPRRKKGNRGWRRLIMTTKKNQCSKIKKHKRGNNKSSWEKDNKGWRGLTRIVNDFKILV